MIQRYKQFLRACRKGDLDIVTEMTTGCASHILCDIVRNNTMEDAEWPPALLCASFGGHLETVQYIVENLAVDVNTQYLVSF